VEKWKTACGQLKPKKSSVENPCNTSTPPVDALFLAAQGKAPTFHKFLSPITITKLLSYPLFREGEEKGGTPS
jgi:hypothetical protein